MREPTAREPKFPVACARCGGRISEPVAFCPHCGAHARFALAGDASRERRGAAASARAEPSVRSFESSDFEGDLDPPWPGPPTPLFATPDGDPYGEVRGPALRGSRQWGLKSGTGLILLAFVVLYGGAVALHRYDGAAPVVGQTQPSASKSVEGSIGSNGPSSSDLSAPSPSAPATNGGVPAPAPVASSSAPVSRSSADGTQGSGAQPAPKLDDSTPPDMSIASLPPPVASVAPPVAPVSPPTSPAQSQGAAPATTTPSAVNNGDGTQQAAGQSSGANEGRNKAHARTRASAGANDARVPPGSAADAKAQPQPQPQEAKEGRAPAARALDSAQVRLAKNDLRGARASLSSALAADPHNGYALSLRDQLTSREQERDASLGAARACVVQARWNCVWHNAGAALSVDASSTEAKALVNRAIVESGAATAPAGPGPDNVQVPMVQ